MEHEHATSLTARAVKRALPDRAILTKDARQTLNSATSVFTLYLASLAHETSVANKRNTITLKDVLQTLRDADFEHFIEPIEACLQEAKVTDCKINAQIIVAEDEEGGETTNEVAHQLEDVAIDTNEEDDDDMVSMDEPISAAAGKV
ncbi:dna polymerase epsilon subunit 3-like [Plasmopara halstedii]|uniref:Dna polymerase epsilon subunit 3-like n=1 Tax=Plasmopara halstedii TaxID=4781 RepID=A0A0P1A7Q0_PLAHL|nr:dna polymerase epsilon subunit 3-like [Plasmopara halstedii]CEG36685.1 dna polymerase epsilon subunit 3-like [Plasmopara halstedii]|eukprot:XP_024573054.1 dna polymerase epsilon subunit 3-like [Plasmopara halstedii]